METEKLYYQDQYIDCFHAMVVQSNKDEFGDYVVLNQTAFYPTGGGQPHDTGKIGDVEVFNVEEVDGEVRHYVAQPLEIDQEYRCELDWDRRFDHMQQHLGQHILSAVLDNEFGYKTISFHLGKDVCAIDLSLISLSKEEIQQAERMANDIIIKNYPVETKWMDEAELAQYTLRKELSVKDNIRLVIIPGIDYNGCGGTHPQSTSEVSSIKILHWEKQKKNAIRVYFVCGFRVLKHLQEKHIVSQRLTNLLNVPQDKLVEQTKRTLLQMKQYEKEMAQLKMERIEYEAYSMIEQSELINELNLVETIYENRSVSELRQLAQKIVENSMRTVVVLLNDDWDKLQLVCARSNDLDVDMNQLVRQILPLLNGKGGGNSSIAQGGGERTIESEQLMDEINKFIRNY